MPQSRVHTQVKSFNPEPTLTQVTPLDLRGLHRAPDGARQPMSHEAEYGPALGGAIAQLECTKTHDVLYLAEASKVSVENLFEETCVCIAAPSTNDSYDLFLHPSPSLCVVAFLGSGPPRGTAYRHPHSLPTAPLQKPAGYGTKSHDRTTC